MPRGGPCDHNACRLSKSGCRMLTDEELTPTDEDVALAAQLVAEGWYSTSSKYRAIARWRDPLPGAEDLIRPDVLATPHGQYLAELWNRHGKSSGRLRTGVDPLNNHPLVEHRELTIRQFQAFKKAGGHTA